MANPYFQFKKFTVWHDKCAMKVGTDGVLLGAWADITHTRRILDIGTGTGLIALMLAQRSQARVDAIDIDRDACLQACGNVKSSPFENRIQVYHTPLSQYVPEENLLYDLIVSNPPYFVDSLKCPDNKRRLARHTDTLPLLSLLHDSRHLLAADGRLALILPYDRKEALRESFRREGYFLSKETVVYSTPSGKPIRLLLELSLIPVEQPVCSELTIELERHVYTEEFKQLVQDFYLKI